MSIAPIIQELATRIAALGFVSQSGAIASDLLNKTKTSPASLVAPLFDKPVFVSLDAKESAITFFKIGPTRSVDQNTYLTRWENEVTLIGWINGKRISESNCDEAQMQILRTVNKARIDLGAASNIRALTIDFTGDNEGQPIGEKYGWNDPLFQYGQYPYRLFEMRFRLSYFVAAGCCLSPIDVLQPPC